MTWQSALPTMILLSALLSGIAIFFVSEAKPKLRKALNFTGAGTCIVLIVLLIAGVYQGQVFEARFPLLPDIDLVLHADALSLLFVALSGFLWLLTTIYAIGYLEDSPNRSRFFGFFSLCVFATIGIALAGNLITFLIFYELLTLTTYPLVVHKGNSASLAAGRKYLIYTMLGGASFLIGVVWLKSLAGPLDFTATGLLAAMPELDPNSLKVIFVLIVLGLGVKAALVPFHGWLPSAMAAPAPVSALLHAVAVVKAGAFGIVRVVYDVYGVEFARDLGLTMLLAILASITIIYGSTRALFQNDLKKRLAYSTVSQVSYIALGTAIAGPIATIGGIAHLVHQGLMKITMFFCAGSIAETLGVTKVDQMAGIGKRMPLTMIAFSLAVLGMIGIPPAAGFVSKWYLGTGALESGYFWVLGVLILSSLLNAMYFLPILYSAWFKDQKDEWPSEKPKMRFEAHWMLVLPPLLTAMLALAAGLFADAQFSPINWVKLIAAREYGEEFTTIINIGVQQIPAMWLTIILPLVCCLFVMNHRIRNYLHWLPAGVSAIALLMYVLSPQGSNLTPWLFFGSVLTLNEVTSPFFLLAAVLWLAASIYAVDFIRSDDNKERFCLFFLLSMSGNFGLVLSQDMSGFISFFTVMSLASYGLVIHYGTPQAIKAGKSYIQWAIFGELLLFTAFAGLAYSALQTAEGAALVSHPSWVIVLLLVGFGIKAGMFAFHVWLPQAHPVAPVAASALLSGIMVKAGLLGWIKFIPFGTSAFVELGSLMIMIGLFSAFYGVFIGFTQHDLKTLLAYSTISQMGIVIAAVGGGLTYPEIWPVLLPVIVLYAMHHGMAKAALFMAAGAADKLPWQRHKWLCWIAICVPAAALAGLPFTTGALSKFALKDALQHDIFINSLLPFTTLGTSLLMLRFLYLVDLKRVNSVSKTVLKSTQASSYIGLIIVSFVLIFTLFSSKQSFEGSLAIEKIWDSTWPILIAGLLFFFLRKASVYLEAVPAGDIGLAYSEVARYVTKGTNVLCKEAHFVAQELLSVVQLSLVRQCNRGKLTLAKINRALVTVLSPGFVIIILLLAFVAVGLYDSGIYQR
ncbi:MULTISPECIES: proton-conducting transporter membrane subunit [Pseudoalteromonas]|uniref:complex I subunit 5 family protein n=1 Tax=Pseudoalteromonas TaxID=53246 RepID=UPI000FFE5F7A|nr:MULTISPECIES: proton-conducting transporter membrane subunit [Pseudoalteromonas]NKC19035.1 sodium:proton antiporter [Pseudoalteromonas galatheae]RXE89001.1 sodium:proton antiporter [Pseudoalteromonas sp. A757]